MFKGRQFDRSVILLCVRWYLAYNLSLRNLEEMMAERGISVDHATVGRWVVHYSPELLERFNRRKRAVRLNPNYSSANALGAVIYNLRFAQNWADQAEVEAGIQLAREALADRHDDPTTLSRAGTAVAFLARDFETAVAATDRALMLNPNLASAYGNSGLIRAWVGDWITSIDHFQRENRLSPFDPLMGYSVGHSLALLGAGRPEEALPWARKAVQELPKFLAGLRALIVTLVELGRVEEARVVGQRLLAQDPKQTVTVADRQIPHQDRQFRERLFAALRTAGIPE